jgi:bifunctional non-homologous end joining protein LigD
MMADSVPAIVALLQMGVLEMHPWGSRAHSLGRPDRIIFDLDPDDAVAWEDLRQAALIVKTLLENIGLAPFLKTTGGKGLHVVVPIEPAVGWEHVKGFTKAVAEFLERTFPDRFTSKLLKISRRGKIFIDYLRNSEGATAVAAYSTRARANAPVSTPVAWSEMSRDLRFDYFNIGNVPKRLGRTKSDPWRNIADAAVPLSSAAMARVGFKAR